MSHYSVKMRPGILFPSSSLVIWAPTYTQHVDTNHGAGERQVYIADLFWKPASSLSRLSLALSLFPPRSMPEPTVPSQRAVFLLLVLWRTAERLQRAVCLSLVPPASGAAVCRLCCVLIDEMLELSWDFWCVCMRIKCVCVCVLYLCMFDCDSVCEHLAGRTFTY